MARGDTGPLYPVETGISQAETGTSQTDLPATVVELNQGTQPHTSTNMYAVADGISIMCARD